MLSDLELALLVDSDDDFHDLWEAHSTAKALPDCKNEQEVREAARKALHRLYDAGFLTFRYSDSLGTPAQELTSEEVRNALNSELSWEAPFPEAREGTVMFQTSDAGYEFGSTIPATRYQSPFFRRIRIP